jgi:PAS domain S-box-containing protein
MACVPAAVAVLDLEGRLVWANDDARALAGLLFGAEARAGLDAAPDVFRLDGTASAREEWPVVRSIEGESVFDEEYVLFAPGGRRVVLRCSTAPLYEHEVIAAVVAVVVDVTAEKDLGERRLYLERVLETIADAIVGTDADFRVTVWNPAAERLYGHTAAEVLGRPARDIASYEGDRSRLQLEDALRETDQTRTELTAVRPDGSRVEVEIVVAAVRDDVGEVVGYLGVHRDVSQRRHDEHERERLASIVQRSSDFIGMADVDGRPTFLNEAGRRMVGFAGDIEQAGVLDFVAPDDRARVRDELLPLIAEHGRAAPGTELCLHHWVTEEAIPALWDAFRIDDPATGEPIGLATITRDISERKRAEGQRENHARQQAALARLGVLALAEDDPQLVMDRAVAVLAETLEVELAGVCEILPDGGTAVLRAAVGFRDEDVGSVTLPLTAGSLARLTVESGRPVVSEDVAADARFGLSEALRAYGPVGAISVVIAGREQPVGILGAFAREHRRFSEEEVHFVQAIANVISVAFETARTETRLREVRDAERRRIARDLHDEALQGLTDALGKAMARAPGSSDDELVGTLKAVGRQLRGAIYDLRLEEEESRPLAERLETLVALQADLAPEIEIHLAAHDVPALQGSRGTEVVRIVGEALTNARRHSGARTIEVDVSTAGDVLRVEVADDGPGPPPDAASPPAGSVGFQGMRERAALLGAALQVGAASPRGVAVRLELPLEVGQTAPVRVLLVEDHATVREAIAAILEREPHLTVVGQAGSLAEARTMLAGVDVALLDLGLPDGFGADLIADLRAHNPDVQAVVLSAGLDRVRLARAVDRGAAGALDKTSHLDEVVDAIRRVRSGAALLGVEEVTELIGDERRRRANERDDRRALADLTPRELEVLQLMADGLDSSQIAERLHISPRTERNHVAGILTKLPVHSRLQAVVFCLRHGVVAIRPPEA